MNFFERQAAARSLSKRLIVLFALAVAAIVAAIDCVILVALSMHDRTQRHGYFYPNSTSLPLSDHHAAIFLTSIIVLGVIAVAALYKSSALSAGGAAVAVSVGGERVPPNTIDPLKKRLLNVVEEIAIASSVPVPQVFVLERETAINAFAAGSSPSNAAIAVTRGALESLDRSELQAVIAHEFSHVLNGDMRLNTRLIGLLFGILVVALAGRFVLRFAPRGDRKSGGAGAAIVMIAFAVMAIGYIGLFFARLIQSAVSRSREKLADASAVQFTRDPQSLRNALVKIGAVENGSTLVETDAEAVAHLLFAPSSVRWFATHPPLLERIRELDPTFQPREFETARQKLSAQRSNAAIEPEAAAPNASARLKELVAAPMALSAAPVVASIGRPLASELARARLIRQSLPEAIVNAATNTTDAVALLMALSLASDPSVREQQLNFLSTQLGKDIADHVAASTSKVNELHPAQRQPALLRLLPTLRQLPQAERQRLLICLNGMQLRDGGVSVDRYALRKLAQIYLFETTTAPVQGRATLKALSDELSILFAVLAKFGHVGEREAQIAYEMGMQHVLPQLRPTYQNPTNWSQKLDLALTKLDALLPAAKEVLIEALVKTIASDGEVNINEAELLRTICAALHCPLPPLVTVE